MNFWGLETQRFFRSHPCESPDGHWLAYTEMMFLPAHRQTTAVVFILPVIPEPPPQPVTRPRKLTWWQKHVRHAILPPPPPDYTAMRKDPQLLSQLAIPIIQMTFQPPFEFTTLQVQAWSPDSQRLTVQQQTGVLHVGWKTSRQWTIDLGHCVIQPGIKQPIR